MNDFRTRRVWHERSLLLSGAHYVLVLLGLLVLLMKGFLVCCSIISRHQMFVSHSKKLPRRGVVRMQQPLTVGWERWWKLNGI